MELDSLLSLIFIIIYGLFSLRSVNIHLSDVYFFCRLFPMLFIMGQFIENGSEFILNIDFLLALLLAVIIYSFNSFESVLLLLFAFIGQYFMLHSIDLLTFYIALEAQNFSFLVLCGLQSNKESSSFSVEATLKYFLLSAFSSGVILYWFSTVYLQTGCSVLNFSSCLDDYSLQSFSILCAMMFKLGAAPLHLWVVQIYSGVKKSLLMYISTAPKLSLFGFWVSSFHTIWTDFSVILFAIFSIILGSFGAYSQPALRTLFAYSTVNEIGLMLMAIETAGFHSLFQHLGIYIISQLLLWNISDRRLFSFVAVTLAGLPPLAGFFGKAWIFWHTGTTGLYTVLILGLFCTAISLVYYLRVLRLFYPSNTSSASSVNCLIIHNDRTSNLMLNSSLNSRVMLTATCIILLTFLPLFVIKPFIVI
jgi:NADH:ubiquinone oxidoreductase subunit 2 (subunit N)